MQEHRTFPRKGKHLVQAYLPENQSFDAEETDTFDASATPLLCIGCDEESKQRSGFHFLRHRGFSVLLFPPIQHRRHNDTNGALKRAGLENLLKKSMIVGNCVYGPYVRGLFHNDLREISVDLSRNLSPNDPVLLACWQRICLSQGWTRDEDTNEQARRKFLDDLPSLPVCMQKGVKASTSK